MQTEAQASGLPFPPLLRKELFDPRGLPEWYCPTRVSRPVSTWMLVGGSAFALAAFLLVICLVPHHRMHRLSGSFSAQSPRCDPGAIECKATLQTRRPDSMGEIGGIDSYLGIAGPLGTDKALGLRIVSISASAQNRDMVLVVTWPKAVLLPRRSVAIALGERRTLVGWLSPKPLAAFVTRTRP